MSNEQSPRAIDYSYNLFSRMIKQLEAGRVPIWGATNFDTWDISLDACEESVAIKQVGLIIINPSCLREAEAYLARNKTIPSPIEHSVELQAGIRVRNETNLKITTYHERRKFEHRTEAGGMDHYVLLGGAGTFEKFPRLLIPLYDPVEHREIYVPIWPNWIEDKVTGKSEKSPDGNQVLHVEERKFLRRKK